MFDPENREWRCLDCGEIRRRDSIDSAWRWNGKGYEHAHGQAGHIEAEPVDSVGDRILKRLNKFIHRLESDDIID